MGVSLPPPSTPLGGHSTTLGGRLDYARGTLDYAQGALGKNTRCFRSSSGAERNLSPTPPPRLRSGDTRLRPESARKEHSVLPFLEQSREEPITNSPPSTSLGEHLNFARGTTSKKHVKITRF